MTNDELRLRLDGLTEPQLRAVIRDHYAPVAERMGQAERGALILGLMDYVDRRGDSERIRLSDIVTLFHPDPMRPSGSNGKAKSTVYSSDNLSTTVAALDAKVSSINEKILENQAQFKENREQLQAIHSFLEPLKEFSITDWIRTRDAVESLRISVRWLMVMFGFTSVVIVIALLMVLIREG